MTEVLVTGAAGHLGANLVRQLVADGESVRVLVRPGSDDSGLAGLDVRRFEADLRDATALRPAVRGATRLFHCAAVISTVAGGEREIYASNVLGTRNLLDAALAEGVERVVVTGSFGAVGHLPDRPSDERVPFDPFTPHTAYQATKVLVAHEALRAHADGLDVVLATSCAIVGPHDYLPSRMGRLLLRFANGQLRAYIDGGFEFVAARDVVAGHLLAMAKGRSGAQYLLGSGYRSMDQLMATFEEVTGRRRPRLKLPPALVGGVGRVLSPLLARTGREQLLTPAAVRLLTQGRRADCTRARVELGYAPTSVEDAIREAHDDFVRRGLIRRQS
ncbi:NAD-dependent epimerase/dehydratase family protein [Lentzea tibetensis]|uniref:NAD-dependent epimerase/dehydratase family protein n=1 Tax=Lentzea tibetensis TaxID=2591470 RepID=A0A563EM42_9PSEU|nr:NAD-dependent epimerase/dehydratase family protein [Lentzea tibetensis]TWP48109.1 NAD-dependent epimerase/dehydratase family protein [Lentzea tibetensis]